MERGREREREGGRGEEGREGGRNEGMKGGRDNIGDEIKITFYIRTRNGYRNEANMLKVIIPLLYFFVAAEQRPHRKIFQSYLETTSFIQKRVPYSSISQRHAELHDSHQRDVRICRVSKLVGCLVNFALLFYRIIKKTTL